MQANTVDLAIIIPTLNEEFYIGKLLDSIINQTVKLREIVVVDAFSKDRTVEEIKKRLEDLPNLRYFKVLKSTISRQRNVGANKTTSSHLLFLDADTVLKQNDTLEKYFDEIKLKKPDIAAAYNLPLSNYWKDKVFFLLMNTTFKIARPIWPVIIGANICITRRAFKRLRGFDEDIRLGEDIDLVQRAAKLKLKFIFLKSINIYTSVRRHVREGRVKFVIKMLKSFYKVLRYGHKSNSMEYEFGKFSGNDRTGN